jgi:cytochrome c oxidase assembly factor CtaG
MQLWCSSQGVAWTWGWQAYPGVWVFIALLAMGYVRATRRAPRAPHETSGAPVWFGAGLALLWLALDWPVGALGAYLASVHMVQFILIGLVAPVFLLLGIPRAAVQTVLERRIPGRLLEFVTRPLPAFAAFTAIMIGTHLPVTTDALMVSQLGSFAIDMAWLVGGVLFWWPIVVALPARPLMSPPMKMGYLVGATMVMVAPGAMITFSDLPLYGVYEMAPPVAGFRTLQEQWLAGLIMKLGGTVVLWTAISILFYRWNRAEVADLRRGRAAQRPA